MASVLLPFGGEGGEKSRAAKATRLIATFKAALTIARARKGSERLTTSLQKANSLCIILYMYVYMLLSPVIYHLRPLKPNLTVATVKS